MSFVQKLKQHKFAVVAIVAIVVYFLYYNMLSVPSFTPPPAKAESKSVHFAPSAAASNSNVREGYANEPAEVPSGPASASASGARQFNTLNLLPSGGMGGSSVEPNINNMLVAPAMRTIQDRVGQQRECNRNGYIVAGVQYKQPPVSTQPLETNLPTICTESTFARNPPS